MGCASSGEAPGEAAGAGVAEVEGGGHRDGVGDGRGAPVAAGGGTRCGLGAAQGRLEGRKRRSAGGKRTLGFWGGGEGGEGLLGGCRGWGGAARRGRTAGGGGSEGRGGSPRAGRCFGARRLVGSRGRNSELRAEPAARAPPPPSGPRFLGRGCFLAGVRGGGGMRFGVNAALGGTIPKVV